MKVVGFRVLRLPLSDILLVMSKTLHELGLIHGTDKATYHGYTHAYAAVMDPLRDTRKTLLELGWGGYNDPDAGGESARMWRDYAPDWCVVSVDVFPKNSDCDLAFRQGSQDDPDLAESLTDEFGEFDFIIDDASHVDTLTAKTLDIWWPRLRLGGWYFIEDLGTSYLTEYGGNPRWNASGTVVAHLKSLIDEVMDGWEVQELRFTPGLAAIRKVQL